MTDFGFRYYGTDPGDWHDYGFVLVRFVAAPDPDIRKRVGAIVDGWHLPGKARRWKADRVLSVFLEDATRATFGVLQEVMREVHAVAPIEQVVNHLARAETDDEWERWSLAQGPPDENLDDPNDMSVWSG
jgi:hypothetical protein